MRSCNLVNFAGKGLLHKGSQLFQEKRNGDDMIKSKVISPITNTNIKLHDYNLFCLVEYVFNTRFIVTCYI